MTFSNPKQIIALMLAWVVALLAVDYVKNPQSIRLGFGAKAPAASSNITKPTVRIWMNHLCCSGCLGDVRKALGTVHGLGTVTVLDDVEAQEQADARGTAKPTGDVPSYANKVDVAVDNIALVDFMAIDRALRDEGLTAEHMEFGGVSHFRLEAELKHICCGLCTTGIDQGMQIAKSLRETGQFAWLDSVSVNKTEHRLVAYARFDRTVDVLELIVTLNHLGFAPSTLSVRADQEG
jgi:hypothetical protein